MIESPNSLLLVAHPGHELLIHGWLARVKPRVCTLTDGSGHHAQPRLVQSSQLLRGAGATIGSLFGRFSDREMYAAILDCDAPRIDSIVDELAKEITEHRISVVVADAMEGFNPVHDLCRMIAGAACALAGVSAHFEYPIDDGPRAFDAVEGAVITDLDDRELAAKLEQGRAFAPVLADTVEMLDRFGAEAFRREAFRRIDDWTSCPWNDDARPLYERIGEQRVALHRYERVIRYADHVRPLLDHLRARASTIVCAS